MNGLDGRLTVGARPDAPRRAISWSPPATLSNEMVSPRQSFCPSRGLVWPSSGIVRDHHPGPHFSSDTPQKERAHSLASLRGRADRWSGFRLDDRCAVESQPRRRGLLGPGSCWAGRLRRTAMRQSEATLAPAYFAAVSRARRSRSRIDVRPLQRRDPILARRA